MQSLQVSAALYFPMGLLTLAGCLLWDRKGKERVGPGETQLKMEMRETETDRIQRVPSPQKWEGAISSEWRLKIRGWLVSSGTEENSWNLEYLLRRIWDEVNMRMRGGPSYLDLFRGFFYYFNILFIYFCWNGTTSHEKGTFSGVLPRVTLKKSGLVVGELSKF